MFDSQALENEMGLTLQHMPRFMEPNGTPKPGYEVPVLAVMLLLI